MGGLDRSPRFHLAERLKQQSFINLIDGIATDLAEKVALKRTNHVLGVDRLPSLNLALVPFSRELLERVLVPLLSRDSGPLGFQAGIPTFPQCALGVVAQLARPLKADLR